MLQVLALQQEGAHHVRPASSQWHQHRRQLTNEARAEAKLALTMPCKEEEDEVNVREGLYAQSRKDFVSKLHIALKEAGETDYWLDIIHTAELTNEA